MPTIGSPSQRRIHLLFLNLFANAAACAFFAVVHYRKNERLLSSGSGKESTITKMALVKFSTVRVDSCWDDLLLYRHQELAGECACYCLQCAAPQSHSVH